jgi:hypothetical protein
MKKILLTASLVLLASFAFADDVDDLSDQVEQLNNQVSELQDNIESLQSDLDDSTIIKTEPVYVDRPVYIDRPVYVQKPRKTVPDVLDDGRTPGKDGRPSLQQVAQWHANLRSRNEIVRKQAREALAIWDKR